MSLRDSLTFFKREYAAALKNTLPRQQGFLTLVYMVAIAVAIPFKAVRDRGKKNDGK
jgi:ABC-type polysaccharide transport system permease subunit